MTQPAASMPSVKSILCVLSEQQAQDFELDLQQLRGPSVELVMASSPEEALPQVGELNPALVIAGMDLGSMEGLEFLALLMNRYPKFYDKVVVLPDRNDPFPPVLQYRDRTTGRSLTENVDWNAIVALARSLPTQLREPSPVPVRAVVSPPASKRAPLPAVDAQSIEEFSHAIEASISPPPGAMPAMDFFSSDPPLSKPTPPPPQRSKAPAAAIEPQPVSKPTPPPPERSKAPAAVIEPQPVPVPAQVPSRPAPLQRSIASTVDVEVDVESGRAPALAIPGRRAPKRGVLIAAAVVGVLVVAVLARVALHEPAPDTAATKPAPARAPAAAPVAPAPPPQAAAAAATAQAVEAPRPTVPASPPQPQPAKATSSAGAEREELSRGLTLPLRFGKGEAAFSVANAAELERVVQVVVRLLEEKPTRVAIEGRTSKEGESGNNARLGLRRAIAVQSYLVEHGVPAKRLVLKSYGTRPLTAEEQLMRPSELRRVTLKLL